MTILIYFFLKKYLPTAKNSGIGQPIKFIISRELMLVILYKYLIYGTLITFWLLFDQFE